jgi:Ricin-type beta-trefoil lectin domain/Subtilase family
MRRLRLGRMAVGRSVIAALTGGALIAGMAVAASATTGGPTRTHTASAGAGLSAGLGHAKPRSGFVAQPHAVRLPAGQKMACGQPIRPGQAACQAIVTTAPALSPAASGVPAIGYGPGALRSAYRLTAASANDGGGRTIAIVDAFNNPDLAKNLASYRHHVNLPACTLSTHCLRIVSQNGSGGSLPKANANWGVEESLDLDMVSAICPRCHILLVEANNASIRNLGDAEVRAVKLGARFVSNSWSGFEFFGQDSTNRLFNHPGDAIVFASGDSGYGTMYPTDTQFVTAVGGTHLVQSTTTRGWTETVWGSRTNPFVGTGSGCSLVEAKPSWQTGDDAQPTGCLNRTENDVAADADPATGVAVYDTYKTGGTFFRVGGTSVATPIITSVYALAGSPARSSYPASYVYQHTSHFFDVTAGTNGRCETIRQYLCHGETGYDGPTGFGTPDGTGGFSRTGVDPVTLVDPGPRTVLSGATFSLPIGARDSNPLTTSLSYSATGLPSGLSIGSVPNSLNGVITGTLPTTTTAQSFQVTVTATDENTSRSNSTTFAINVIPPLTNTANAPVAGPIKQQFNTANCLTAASTTTLPAVVATHACVTSNVTQQWQIVSGAAPGSTEAVQLGGTSDCLRLNNQHLAVLQVCDLSANEQWYYEADLVTFSQLDSVLVNPATGLCLSASSTQAKATACPGFATKGQSWNASPTSVVSGLDGSCLSFAGSTLQTAACSPPGDATQAWRSVDGNLKNIQTGMCLAIKGLLDGNKAVMGTQYCGNASQTFVGVWVPGPAGQLINVVSGKCLDDFGGTFELMECYGQPGEVWGLN